MIPNHQLSGELAAFNQSAAALADSLQRIWQPLHLYKSCFANLKCDIVKVSNHGQQVTKFTSANPNYGVVCIVEPALRPTTPTSKISFRVKARFTAVGVCLKNVVAANHYIMECTLAVNIDGKIWHGTYTAGADQKIYSHSREH